MDTSQSNSVRQERYLLPSAKQTTPARGSQRKRGLVIDRPDLVLREWRWACWSRICGIPRDAVIAAAINQVGWRKRYVVLKNIAPANSRPRGVQNIYTSTTITKDVGVHNVHIAA